MGQLPSKNKIENEGATAQGQLSANEFNQMIDWLDDLPTDVKVNGTSVLTGTEGAKYANITMGSAAEKTAGSGAGNVPVIGTTPLSSGIVKSNGSGLLSSSETIEVEEVSGLSNRLSTISSNINTNTSRIMTVAGRVSNVETELDDKADLVDGKVPSSQLPSYVDDVIDFTKVTDHLPTGDDDPRPVVGQIWYLTTDITGYTAKKFYTITAINPVVMEFAFEPEDGKIYIAEADNTTYRWSGQILSPIRGDLTLGTTHQTAAYGDEGYTAYQHSQSTGNPHNTAIGDISGLQTELNGKADTTALASHTSNTTVHITTAERTSWNGKATGNINGRVITINSDSLTVPEGVVVDSSLSQSSTNPVQNKVIADEIINLQDADSSLHDDITTETSRAQTAESALQTAINGKAPTSHTHTTSQVTGLDSALANKAPLNHTHAISDVNNLQSALNTKVDAESGKGLSTEDYTSAEKIKLAGIVVGTTFTGFDSTDIQEETLVLGMKSVDISSKADTTALNAEVSRAQAVESALQTAVDGKAPTSHTHTKSQITDFAHTHDDRYYTESEVDTALAGKAAASHSHVIGDVADLGNAISTLNSSISTVSSNLGSHASDTSNTHSVTAAQVGLGNVDNTADADKSVSYANTAGAATNWSGKPSWIGSSKPSYSYSEISGTPTLGTASALDSSSDLATSHSGCLPTVGAVNNGLNGKANSSHTHSKSEITDFAHNHDDRYYTEDEVDDALSGKSDTGHTHDDRYYTETETDTLLGAKQNTISDLATIRSNAAAGATAHGWGDHAQAGYALQTSLNTKVDKVSGKGLSTNDYTDAEKIKLSGIVVGTTFTGFDSTDIDDETLIMGMKSVYMLANFSLPQVTSYTTYTAAQMESYGLTADIISALFNGSLLNLKSTLNNDIHTVSFISSTTVILTSAVHDVDLNAIYYSTYLIIKGSSNYSVIYKTKTL